jgi:hypothetical protein
MKIETSYENCSHCECEEHEVKLDKLYPCPRCGKPLRACNYCQNEGRLCNWKKDNPECNFYRIDGTVIIFKQQYNLSDIGQ